jgi:hypothetical protein
LFLLLYPDEEDFQMMNRIRSIRSVATVAALFVAVATPAFAADLPDVAQAGKEKAQELTDRVNKEERKKIRMANDLKLKSLDPSFPEQAKAQAQNFRATAEIVARQGGDAKPLLDAADYFESQSELISKSKGHELPDVRGHVHVHKPVVPGAAPAH